MNNNGNRDQEKQATRFSLATGESDEPPRSIDVGFGPAGENAAGARYERTPARLNNGQCHE